MLDQMDDPIGLVQVDEVDRKKHANRVNTTGRRQPDSIVGLQTELAQSAFQAHE